MAKQTLAESWIIAVVAAGMAGVISAAGGLVLWRTGHHVWFWMFLAVVGYLAVAVVLAARHPSDKNPWEHYRGVWTTPPRKTREALSRRWNKEHHKQSDT